MLEDEIKNEIKKCSRCALCVQNCPIFNVKKDENNTSRGLICKLSGFEKGILSEEDIKKDFKICLNCSKCKQNCPSKVDTVKVFTYKNAQFFPSLLNQKMVLFLKFLPIKFLYFLNLFKKINFKTKKNDEKILYFKGCMAQSQHKISYLDKNFEKGDFSCCGLPYLTSGDLKSYNKVKEKNIKLIKSASKVVFDCASCISAVREYPELDEVEKEKLVFFVDLIDEKTISKLKLKKNSKYKNKTITFHKPCHMSNGEFFEIENILKNIKGINYKRLENYDSCCGFGGSYFIFHPIISTLISLKKMKTIKKSCADLVLTSCPACTLGLRYGQIISFNFKKTLELRDFIEKELEI